MKDAGASRDKSPGPPKIGGKSGATQTMAVACGLAPTSTSQKSARKVSISVVVGRHIGRAKERFFGRRIWDGNLGRLRD
jgi:hypothetical protein